MILERLNVSKYCEDLRRGGKKVVFTNGCFDIIHLGHVRYLADAKRLGDVLFVGVNSDSSVKTLKGSERPLQNEMDRAYILSALKSVDVVSIFNEDNPLALITEVRPDVLVKGGDWTPDKIIGGKEVKSWGGEVLSLPFLPEHSTSDIVAKIKKL